MSQIKKVSWVLVQDQRALYVRSRGKILFYNPGGKPLPGESDGAALTREIQEELGVVLDPSSLCYLHTFEAQADGKPAGVTVQIRCFAATYRGELRPASEIEELAWFTSLDRDRTTETGGLILDWLSEEGWIM